MNHLAPIATSDHNNDLGAVKRDEAFDVGATFSSERANPVVTRMALEIVLRLKLLPKCKIASWRSFSMRRQMSARKSLVSAAPHFFRQLGPQLVAFLGQPGAIGMEPSQWGQSKQCELFENFQYLLPLFFILQTINPNEQHMNTTRKLDNIVRHKATPPGSPHLRRLILLRRHPSRDRRAPTTKPSHAGRTGTIDPAQAWPQRPCTEGCRTHFVYQHSFIQSQTIRTVLEFLEGPEERVH
jgi:hypothetical protein